MIYQNLYWIHFSKKIFHSITLEYYRALESRSNKSIFLVLHYKDLGFNTTKGAGGSENPACGYIKVISEIKKQLEKK